MFRFFLIDFKIDSDLEENFIDKSLPKYNDDADS